MGMPVANIMTESIVWHKYLPAELQCDVPSALWRLMQASSLTVALKSLPYHFSVRLLHLGAVAWQPHEAGWIGCDADTSLYGREVVLCLDDVPVVWARSVCVANAQQWRDLLNCGTRPLGERLFDHSLPLRRTPFDYAHAVFGDSGVAQAVWMRRSVFDWQGEALFLGEAFLPSLAGFLNTTSP